eukprot:Sspe_Gene.51024::Locus_28343_Transcript_1_1_Confidence_1.000_Length_666::g.51024::m.51024
MTGLALLCLVAALLSGSFALEKKGTSQHLWEDTEATTAMWRAVSTGNLAEVKAMIESDPNKVTMRSRDGRGPLWWAYENKQQEIITYLLEAGVNPDEKDADGKQASEMGDPDLTEYIKAEYAMRQQEMKQDDVATDDEYDEE